jgi:hypothetical protein
MRNSRRRRRNTKRPSLTDEYTTAVSRSRSRSSHAGTTTPRRSSVAGFSQMCRNNSMQFSFALLSLTPSQFDTIETPSDFPSDCLVLSLDTQLSTISHCRPPTATVTVFSRAFSARLLATSPAVLSNVYIALRQIRNNFNLLKTAPSITEILRESPAELMPKSTTVSL